ncbi:hypothetical protein EJB05_29065 [Eragrostis curvula]|uniref:C2 domain-containing protein n=1 Tax=Eragrostis curvula TaxID=38414 RepID=A0A5J9USL3_9POAL|nr:hypothetical protein EJB05_29065 [Eragrostis curvula]
MCVCSSCLCGHRMEMDGSSAWRGASASSARRCSIVLQQWAWRPLVDSSGVITELQIGDKSNDLKPIWNEHLDFIIEDADAQSDLQPGKVKDVEACERSGNSKGQERSGSGAS